MPAGGARSGAGRRKGSLNKITQKAREKALETGELPHEWLLKIARGEPIPQKIPIIEVYKTGPMKGMEKSRTYIVEDVYASFQERIDAAKSAAPYFAPKLATVTGHKGNFSQELHMHFDSQDSKA